VSVTFFFLILQKKLTSTCCPVSLSGMVSAS